MIKITNSAKRVQGLIIFKTISKIMSIQGSTVGCDQNNQYTWIYEGSEIKDIYEQFMNDYKYLNTSDNHQILFSTLNYEDYQGKESIKIRTS